MTAPKATLVIGLPASGKSYVAQAVASESGALVFDDCEWNLVPLQQQFDSAIPIIKSGRLCVLNDVSWCDPSVLSPRVAQLEQEVPGIEIRFVYLANNRKNCTLNAVRDFYREVDGQLHREPFDNRSAEQYLAARLLVIREFTKRYEIPTDMTPVPVETGSWSS
jgi:hypothetical protein